jgi:hypothetical protein
VTRPSRRMPLSGRSLLSPSFRESCRELQPLLQQHFTHFVQHVIAARSIPQVQPERQFVISKILRRLSTAVLTFFFAGLLYVLRLERVDNLGAHSIPSETGPSHRIY